MEVAHGYKESEAGAIPENWSSLRLGAIATYIGSGTSRTRSVGGDYPVYGSTGVIGASNICDYSGDALLVARVGANAGTLNVVSGSYGVTDNTLIVTFDGRYSLPFISYQLERRRLNTLVFGSGQPLITGSQLKGLVLAVPPKPEQDAIADALRDVDDEILSLERLIEKTGNLKQAVTHELLTGNTRLPGFRGEWGVKSLGEVFSFSGGFTASRDQLSMDGYCYLHYGDIHGATKSFIDVSSEYHDIPKLDVPLNMIPQKSLLANGDVVFVDASEDEEGTSRHVVIINEDAIPFISGLHTIVAKAKTKELAHQYLRYCFQTCAVKAQFRFYAVGTKVSGISKTNIGKIDLQVPPLPEQIAIGDILSDMDSELEALDVQLSKVRDLKQGMMQELLTGK